MTPPDVIVAWLQHEYGQLGRPAEAVAHALVDEGIARRAVYVEPFVTVEEPAAVEYRQVRGLDLYTARGVPPANHEFARAVLANSGLSEPILLNFGVAETNWWFLHEFGPLCRRTALVTHDVLATMPGLAPERVAELERVHELLVGASHPVLGLSEGSIAGLPGAVYVGHGVDSPWTSTEVDSLDEPADMAAIPHPRALYLGSLSMRIEIEAFRAIARAGIQVVLLGFAPSAALQHLIAEEPNVHFLGPREPAASPPYLLAADVGLIPHTPEPFTDSMEPHKIYNYAAAGLRTVVLNCRVPPALEPDVETAGGLEDVAAATSRALASGRLEPERVRAARARTWGDVARRMLDAVG